MNYADEDDGESSVDDSVSTQAATSSVEHVMLMIT